MRILVAAGAAMFLLIASQAEADVLARLTQGEPLKIGFREDTAPFSYRNELGQPVGFTVELCGVIVGDLKQELGLPDLLVEFIPVGAENRFAALQDGAIDLLSESVAGQDTARKPTRMLPWIGCLNSFDVSRRFLSLRSTSLRRWSLRTDVCRSGTLRG